MSKVKASEEESYKNKPFNGERARWEDYHRYLRITINKQEELPENWLNYLFDDYPMDPNDATLRMFPAEFVTRVVPDPLAENASAVLQQNRNEVIRRDEKHNEQVRKPKAILVEILSSSVSQSLQNIFHDTYNIVPHAFYSYLKTSFGPLSNQNEDLSVAMHGIMTLNMAHTETFTSFMTRFNNKAEYLKLEKGARRGLLTATMANTQGKIQLLPDRLVKELRRVREIDMTYDEMLIWLTQQDINQMNDGLKVIRVKKIMAETEKDDSKKYADKVKGKINIVDPNGLE